MHGPFEIGKFVPFFDQGRNSGDALDRLRWFFKAIDHAIEAWTQVARKAIESPGRRIVAPASSAISADVRRIDYEMNRPGPASRARFLIIFYVHFYPCKSKRLDRDRDGLTPSFPGIVKRLLVKPAKQSIPNKQTDIRPPRPGWKILDRRLSPGGRPLYTKQIEPWRFRVGVDCPRLRSGKVSRDRNPQSRRPGSPLNQNFFGLRVGLNFPSLQILAVVCCWHSSNRSSKSDKFQTIFVALFPTLPDGRTYRSSVK